MRATIVEGFETPVVLPDDDDGFMQEVVDELTRPLNDEEKKTGVVKREKKLENPWKKHDNIPL